MKNSRLFSFPSPSPSAFASVSWSYSYPSSAANTRYTFEYGKRHESLAGFTIAVCVLLISSGRSSLGEF